MATTCDYCHKPLSLMRRLRGEQFCSVEHLDQFTAQQAELALERLAAVDLLPTEPLVRPVELPPPTLKLVPRESEEAAPPPTEAPAAELDLNRLFPRETAKAETLIEPKLQAKIETVAQSESEAAFLRLAEVVNEPRVVPPPPPAQTVAPKPVPEYPLAAFVSPVEVTPRSPRKQSGLESFAPVETWGRAKHPSAMPKLRTRPADISEIRTWTAGKLASKVPPPAPSREFLAGKSPSAFAGPQGGEFEPEILSNGGEPKLPALDAQVEEIQGEWQGTEILRLLCPLSGFRFQHLQLSTFVSEFALLPEEFQSTIRQPLYHWVPSGAVVAPAYASFRIVSPEPQSGSLIAGTTGLEFVITEARSAELGQTRPEFSWLPATPMRETWRSCPLEPLATSALSDVAALDAELKSENAVALGTAPLEIGWATAVPMREAWRSCPPAPVSSSLQFDLAAFGAEWTPWADVALPAPPTWDFMEGFEAGRVSMPVWQSAPVLAPARPMLSWTDGTTEFSTVIAIPGLPGTMLAIGRMGPSFGWEQAPARMGLGPEACAAQDAVTGKTEVQIEPLKNKVRVVPSPAPAILPDAHQVQAGEQIALPMEGEALEPAGSAPKFHDFRARVRTGLPPGPHRGYEEWAQPRLDVSMIVTEPIAASRPALAEVHADMEQPYRFETARFRASGPASTPIEARDSEDPYAIPFEGSTSGFMLSYGNRSLTVAAPKMLQTRRAGSGPRASASGFSETIQTAGPVRYSAVALVVVPPPEFALLVGTPTIEERFVAQGPVNSRSLPLVRHIGYRMMGPFPKLPPCMPERSFVLRPAEFAAPVTEVPLRAQEQTQDLQGLPQFPVAGKFHLHPADYWAWPAIKAPHGTRVAAEAAVETQVSVSSPVRRFGPGRSGLQANSKTADGHPRARA